MKDGKQFAPGEFRTHDLCVISTALYQLSYWGVRTLSESRGGQIRIATIVKNEIRPVMVAILRVLTYVQSIRSIVRHAQ